MTMDDSMTGQPGLCEQLMTLDPAATDDAPTPLQIRDALRRADAILQQIQLSRAKELLDPALLNDLRDEADGSRYAGYLALLVSARRDPFPGALAHHALGRSIQAAERDPAQVIPHLEIAHCCYVAAGAPPHDRGRLLLTYSNALFALDVDQAILDEALAIAQEASALLGAENRLHQAIALANLADIHERRQEGSAAIACDQQAIAILDPLAASNPTAAVWRGRIARDLAEGLALYQGSFPAADQALNLALEAAAGDTDAMNDGSLDDVAGLLALLRGRLFVAAACFARSAATRAGAGNDLDLAQLRLSEARLAIALADPLMAIQALREAQALLRPKQHTREIAEARLLEAQARLAHTPIQRDLVGYLLDEATAGFTRCIDSYGLAQAALARAQLDHRRGDPASAARYEEALSQFVTLKRPQPLLEAQVAAALARDTHDPVEIQALYAALLPYEGFVSRARLALALAETHERRGAPHDAERHYQAALSDLDQARLQIRLAAPLSALLTTLRRPYERCFAYAAARGDVEACWAAAERPRVAALADSMHNGRSPEGDDPDDPAIRADLRQARDRLDHLITTGIPDDLPNLRYRSDPEAIRLAEHQVLAQIRAARLRGAADSIWQVAPVPQSDALRTALGSSTALVIYTLIGRPAAAPTRRPRRDLWALVLRADGLHRVGSGPIAHHEELEPLLMRLPQQVIAAGAEKPDPVQQTQISRSLRELDDTWLAPIADLIRGVQNLIVVLPDDTPELHALPLHAAFDGRQYLIERHAAVSYAPSAGVLLTCLQGPRRAARSALIAGYRTEREGEQQIEEIKAVAAALPWAAVRQGPIEREALLAAVGAADLIHLHYHGIARQSRHAGFAHLVIGPRRILCADDLAVGTLRAELVTLSACEVGYEAQAGLGLTGGLLAAGARSVASALWPVNSTATRVLMTAFYQALLAGHGRAAALGDAQRALLRGKAGAALQAPHAWAAFTLSGAPDPLVLPDRSGR